MREYHASNGISYIAFAGNVEFDDPAFTLRPNVRLCRDQLHIYKVIAQCLNVDLAPIGVWIVGQNLDDFSDSGEGGLPRLNRSA